ncbi:pilus assembly protein PilM [Candidatus Omnitrophota bacterium]
MSSQKENAIVKYGDFLTVEISDTHLKLGYLKISKSKKEIVSASATEISQLSESEVSEKINEFAATQHIKKCEAINVIPSHFAITKNIEIPSIDLHEIKEIIDLQAGSHTPYSREEIIMDYKQVGVFHERYTKILLVIVKRDVITKRYDIIKSAGFKAAIAVLEAEPVSVICFDSLLADQKDKPVGIAHVDSASIDFSVVEDGSIIYLRTIPIGAGSISSGPEEKKRFLDELKMSLESYQAENVASLPSRIVFTGMTEHLSGIEKDIQSAAGVSIDIVPLSSIVTETNDIADSLQNNNNVSLLPVIAPPLVLDSIGLNLIPEDVKINRKIKQKAKEVTRLGMFSMAALIILCAVLLTGMIFKKLYLSRLLSSYTKENQEVQRLKEISERTGIIKRFLNKKGESLYVLTELYNAMPEEVYLSSFSLREDGSLMVTGTADSMSQVFSLVTGLENNKSFKNVTVDFTKSRMLQGKELADFGLTLFIEQRI